MQYPHYTCELQSILIIRYADNVTFSANIIKTYQEVNIRARKSTKYDRSHNTNLDYSQVLAMASNSGEL